MPEDKVGLIEKYIVLKPCDPGRSDVMIGTVQAVAGDTPCTTILRGEHRYAKLKRTWCCSGPNPAISKRRCPMSDDKQKPVYLRVMATNKEAHLLRSYFDPRLPVKVGLVEPAPGCEGNGYKPEEPVELRVEFNGMAPPTKTIAYDPLRLWVKRGLLLLDKEEAKIVLGALAEAEWSCNQVRMRHEAAAREYHYAGYDKSAEAREACAEDNLKRAEQYDSLYHRLRERLEG